MTKRPDRIFYKENAEKLEKAWQLINEVSDSIYNMGELTEGSSNSQQLFEDSDKLDEILTAIDKGPLKNLKKGLDRFN